MEFQEPYSFRNEKITKELQLSFSSTEEQLRLVNLVEKKYGIPKCEDKNCPLISQPWSPFSLAPLSFSPQIKLLHIKPLASG